MCVLCGQAANEIEGRIGHGPASGCVPRRVEISYRSRVDVVGDEKVRPASAETGGLLAPTVGTDRPPPDLGTAGRALWTEMNRMHPLCDPATRKALAQACRSLDLAKRYRAQLAVEGELIRTTSGLRANPLLFREISALALCIHDLTRLSSGKLADAGPSRHTDEHGPHTNDLVRYTRARKARIQPDLPALPEHTHAGPTGAGEDHRGAVGQPLQPNREPRVELEGLRAAMAGQVFAGQC